MGTLRSSGRSSLRGVQIAQLPVGRGDDDIVADFDETAAVDRDVRELNGGNL